MSHKRISIFAMALFIISMGQNLYAQQEQISAEQLAAVKKLGFLVGQWKGTAWSVSPSGEKTILTQTENVTWKLGGAVLMIEGLGKVKDPGTGKEKVAHEALAVVDFDMASKAYRFRSYTATGLAADAEAELTGERSFVWQMRTPNGYMIRYKLDINPKGQWVEVGEYSRDGQNWQQFFGMTLDKLD